MTNRTLTYSLDKIIEDMQDLKKAHHVSDDSYYSCPKSGECSNESLLDDLTYCDCGADEHNAKVDKIIESLTLYRQSYGESGQIIMKAASLLKSRDNNHE